MKFLHKYISVALLATLLPVNVNGQADKKRPISRHFSEGLKALSEHGIDPNSTDTWGNISKVISGPLRAMTKSMQDDEDRAEAFERALQMSRIEAAKEKEKDERKHGFERDLNEQKSGFDKDLEEIKQIGAGARAHAQRVQKEEHHRESMAKQNKKIAIAEEERENNKLYRAQQLKNLEATEAERNIGLVEKLESAKLSVHEWNRSIYTIAAIERLLKDPAVANSVGPWRGSSIPGIKQIGQFLAPVKRKKLEKELSILKDSIYLALNSTTRTDQIISSNAMLELIASEIPTISNRKEAILYNLKEMLPYLKDRLASSKNYYKKVAEAVGEPLDFDFENTNLAKNAKEKEREEKGGDENIKDRLSQLEKEEEEIDRKLKELGQ
jgi:hypothetical protein